MIKKIYNFLHKNNIRGKDRIYKFLKNNNLPYLVYIVTPEGVKMKLDPKNYVDHYIIKTGSYESEVLDALSQGANENDVLWDIGANIGFHSLSFKKKFPNIKVYSFEPDYSNFSSLYQNVILNKLEINLVNFALSSSSGCSKLYSIDGNHGMSTLNPWHEFNWKKHPHFIGHIDGDFLIENNHFSAPTIIKLDVEGHELMVLKGLNQILSAKKVRKIILEVDKSFLLNDSEIKTFLSPFGYLFKILDRKEDTDHGLCNIEAYLN